MLPRRKGSILLRPVKENLHNPNTEHQEVEYQREQAKWHGKARRHAETEERFRRCLYPEPADVQRNYEELQRVQQVHAAARAAQSAATAANEARWAQRAPLKEPVLQTRRPWEVAAGSVPEEAAAAARRSAAAQDAAENQRMAAAAAARRMAERANERECERRAVTAEESFFNYGAASQRWIAPERRLRHTSPSPAGMVMRSTAVPGALANNPAARLRPAQGRRRPQTDRAWAQSGQPC
ncbi:hypothetical protein WJX81_001141 [Elliptochloris bilobata]|uniref:Uncharacterized protein n=1 Tax=Elliptochloris bilobata TaxID=381761 RepID=A0AAW1RGT2_9CHLO